MPRSSNKAGVHYLGVAPVEFDGRGEAVISRQHLRFAPEFGGQLMSYFGGNPEGLANTGADFDDADVIEFGDEGWTYYDSMGGVPSMDNVYAESMGKAPRPLNPRQAKPYLTGRVRTKSSWKTYIVYVIAPDKQGAKLAAKMVLGAKPKYKGKFKKALSQYTVFGPKGVIPSPGILPFAPHIPMPPMPLPIPVWTVKVPKASASQSSSKSAAAPKPGASSKDVGVTTMMDRMVHERRHPNGDRKTVGRISDWQQLEAQQDGATHDGIPQNLPYGGLTYPGGEGDSYNADPAENNWEEQGVNQARYDNAVRMLLADEFGALPYGVSDTGANIAPVDLLASETSLWDSAFGGDVYNEGSGILYDGYESGNAPMTARQLHALSDPADVDFGADPYSNYFGRGCGC